VSARVQYVLYREENFAKAASSTAEEVDQEDADQLEAADRAADRAAVHENEKKKKPKTFQPCFLS
jgi:hypothetical protein